MPAPSSNGVSEEWKQAGQRGAPKQAELRRKLSQALEKKHTAESQAEAMKQKIASMIASMESLHVAEMRGRKDMVGDASLVDLANAIEALQQENQALEEHRDSISASLNAKGDEMFLRRFDMCVKHRKHTLELKDLHKLECQQLVAADSAHLHGVAGVVDKLKYVRNLLDVDLGPAEEPLFLQDICWGMFLAFNFTYKKMPAFLCDSSDYRILDISHAACWLWGARVQGESVLDLLDSNLRTVWPCDALEVGSDSADITDVLVRDLGSGLFVSNKGMTFDASVITVHLPAEPARGTRAAMIVIMELRTVPMEFRETPTRTARAEEKGEKADACYMTAMTESGENFSRMTTEASEHDRPRFLLQGFLRQVSHEGV